MLRYFIGVLLVIFLTGCSTKRDLDLQRKAFASMADACKGKISVEIELNTWTRSIKFNCDNLNMTKFLER